MGIMDKVMFWKKKDDFSELGLGVEGDLGKELGLGGDVTGLGGVGTGGSSGGGGNANLPGFGDREQVFGGETPLTASPSAPFTPEVSGGPASFPRAPPQMPAAPQFAPQQFSSDSYYIVSKELEIISTKLDALRVGIDSVSHRLAALERIARGENERSW